MILQNQMCLDDILDQTGPFRVVKMDQVFHSYRSVDLVYFAILRREGKLANLAQGRKQPNYSMLLPGVRIALTFYPRYLLVVCSCYEICTQCNKIFVLISKVINVNQNTLHNEEYIRISSNAKKNAQVTHSNKTRNKCCFT